jgi:two-component system, NtrC family, nitrogen regulation sensor histidine kinase NtrY
MDRGAAMTLRQKLLLTISGLVVLVVAAVAWTVSMRTSRALERIEQQRSAALLAQVRGEFQRQGDAVSQALQRMAASERVQRIAFEVSHGGDVALYVPEAAALAQEYQLDFLELVNSDGTILSSAQASARFGYREQLAATNGPFLQSVETNEGESLGLICQREILQGGGALYLVGGRKLDADFLRTLPLSDGMYVWLYGSNKLPLDAGKLLGSAPVAFDYFRDILSAALASDREIQGMVNISPERFDHADVQAVPMKNQAGAVSAVLLVGVSRRPVLELLQHIRSIAYAVAGGGILLAILASLWVSGVFSRPVEELASAAREVAAGNWDVHVAKRGRDELGELAEAFNTMTHELLLQRERLLQAERVAAWRELARRLAHELKNPLFPLQITVENLLRARQLPEAEFEEVFQESSRTLLEEIAHLKAIIGRFSDFSKMPQPERRTVHVNALVEQVAALHRSQLQESPNPVTLKMNLDSSDPQAALDPELMHRVLSNLLLNALDAMPKGGLVELATRASAEGIEIAVSDSGVGLTPEERDRLFTPYYTSKQHGTGLGLAIVQSVVSDHGGSIGVSSEPGCGTTFTIRIPNTFVVSASTPSAGGSELNTTTGAGK